MFEPTIKFREVTRSTNQDMKDLIERNKLTNNELPELFTLAAGFQEAGRGQGSNRWFSDAGENILATIYFRPPISAAEQFRFNQFFSISIRQFLLKYVPEVEIKWPNDIYVEGKKIAGILIEHSVCGERLSHTIAGIGLNVNQADFPPALPNPVSLFQLTGKRYDVKTLAREIVTKCAENYEKLQKKQFEELDEEYLGCLYRKDVFASYLINNQIVCAKITGTDRYGRLLLVDRDGNAYCCCLKEIVFQ